MRPRTDPETFKAAFDRDYPFICRLVQGIVGDFPAAEDVAQEAFVRLYRDPPSDMSNVRGWLATVAVNLALNHLRSERARTRREGEADGRSRGTVFAAEGASGSAEDEFAKREGDSITRSALAALPERERLTLLMRAGGMSYKEIAQSLKVKDTSIGTLLARARQAFRSEYTRLREGDDGVL